jgi:hypothetical protein
MVLLGSSAALVTYLAGRLLGVTARLTLPVR